ncbi:cutinase [Mycobacterium sp. 1274761.0]|nr:cutinase family protein [Mycobacterium sp. 1274761.0]OBK70915.1 cutinase [Mycobacterium sp. 1274761.0]
MGPIAMAPRVLSLAAAAVLAAVLILAPAAQPFSSATLIPAASAACPDVEVVFARGRQEPPGVGAIGDALVNSLRSKVALSVGVYGVNYPADLGAASGASDMSSHVQSMARSCPNTRMVLGGYSLGATAADLMTRANPLPPDVNQHVAAVALFGNGAKRLGPAPAFAGRTIDQCADGDPICGRGVNWPSHLQPSYLGSGLVDQAASFIAGRL